MITIPTKRNCEEENLDQLESKRRKFREFEIDEDFKNWLCGDSEFLKGIDA